MKKVYKKIRSLKPVLQVGLVTISILTIGGLSATAYVLNSRSNSNQSDSYLEESKIADDEAQVKEEVKTAEEAIVSEPKQEDKPKLVKPSPESQPQPAPKALTVSEQRQEWMRQAGLKQSDWAAAEELVQLISQWTINPNRLDSPLGYGLGHLPPHIWERFGCSKTDNPVDHLSCMNIYMGYRYESWNAALERYKRSGIY